VEPIGYGTSIQVEWNEIQPVAAAAAVAMPAAMRTGIRAQRPALGRGDLPGAAGLGGVGLTGAGLGSAGLGGVGLAGAGLGSAGLAGAGLAGSG